MDEIVPKWAKQLIVEVSELRNQVGGLETQVGINCKKLDKIDNTLNDVKTTVNSISEIVTANGEGIEVLSQRLDKLE